MIIKTTTDSAIGRKAKKYTNRWMGIIRTVICDEGHRLRYKNNRTYSMVQSLSADYYWFVTVTPVINFIFVSSFILIRREIKLTALERFRVIKNSVD
jgi:SNF2-related domain